MMPAVGKSGAGISLMSSSIAHCGSFSTSRQASITSDRLCGGMLVAMPTAMPEEPFSSRFGMLAVVVVDEIDGFLVDVGQQFGRQALQAALGVAVGRGVVAVHRAEIA